jgi:chemotaxis protein methyltransferase CheR
VLSADKQYLVESRLSPVAHRAGCDGLSELVQKLRGGKNEPLITKVAEAMTTNESFFFRDKLPFEHFRDTIVPALLAARTPPRPIRIWCAAASTGEQPYSLAMSLKEMGDKIAGRRRGVYIPNMDAKGGTAPAARPVLRLATATAR